MKGLKVFIFLQNTDTIQHTHILDINEMYCLITVVVSPWGWLRKTDLGSYTENKEGSMGRQKSWQKSRDRKMHGGLRALN